MGSVRRPIRGKLAGVKHSEFWEAVDATLGRAHGRSLVTDLVLAPLGGRSAAQGLDDGVPPQTVWDAICEEMELGEAARWHHRGTLRGARRRR